jgi:hypothetical protein
MTLEEFLHWDDGTDTRYELIDGFPLAIAPPAEAHRILAVRLVSRIDAALRGGARATPRSSLGWCSRIAPIPITFLMSPSLAPRTSRVGRPW